MPFSYRRTAVARDVALLASVPALLVALHVLVPFSGRAALALRYESPVPISFLTAAYVHADTTHLVDNLVGYVTVAAFAYGLCLQACKRRWFHVAAPGLFVVAPVVVNVASYLLVARLAPGVVATGLGFSGVVSAFGGFVLVAILVYLRTRHSSDTVVSVGLLLALGLLLELDAIYAGGLRPVPAALALVGIGVVAYGLRDARTDAGARADALVVVLVGVTLAVVVANLFPRDAVVGAAVVNVFAHAVGFLCGVGVALVSLSATRE